MDFTALFASPISSSRASSQPNWEIYQALSPQALTPYSQAIADLLQPYHAVLLTDDMRTHCPETNNRILLENIRSYSPWLWLLVEPQTAHQPRRILAMAALDDIHPGQSARLHGVRLPGARYTPGVNQTIAKVLATAFGPCLNLKTLYADFEANNRGAKGFCWRYGFRYQKTLPLPSRINGTWQPVHRYQLHQEKYLREQVTTLNSAH